MQDRNVEFPNRFRMVKVEGTDDIYDVIPAPGEVLNPGTLLNKANLLTDETAALLGMEQENPTVNEAFVQISTPQAGTGTLYVYCKDEAGEPVSGCVVQIGEELAVTGASGAVKYFLAPGTHSVTIVSPIDYGAESQTKSVAVALSETISIEATIQDTTGGTKELRLTSSVPYATFSDRVTSADVFGVGGGGGGGCAYGDDDPQVGIGGAGGKTAMKTGIDTTKILSIVVGAAGSGSTKTTTTSTTRAYSSGTAGGTTSVQTTDGTTLLSADGGEGGYGYFSANSNGANGGSGSGAVAGAQTTSTSSAAGNSGSDGSDGESAKVNGSNYAATYTGGTGQGTTTRLWHEPDGELFSSAGGSAGQSTLSADNCVVGEPGPGAGEAFAAWYGGSVTGAVVSGGAYAAGNATTYGSGGGGLAIRVSSSMANTVTSGNGMQGLVVFRWEVAA